MTGEMKMKLRTMIGGAVAAIALGGAAMAGGFPAFRDMPAAPAGQVILAQADEALQEQVRRLNGRVEELNYQLLQMQEQMRKMQEDVDFRLQELEGGGDNKKTDAGATQPRKKSEVTEPATSQTADSGSVVTPAAPQGQGVSTAQTGEPTDALPGSNDTPTDPALAATTKSIGSITFDQNGNVVGGSVGDQSTIAADPNGAAAQPGADNTIVAALPQTNDPEELYRTSYEYILSGQYATAEAGFAEHAKRFPQDVKAPDARFWMGEAQLGQRKYREAAETFLAANKQFPKSKKAPEMLLKLGVSLVGLNQRDVACATFAEIAKRYPNTSGALKERVAQEQSQASC